MSGVKLDKASELRQLACEIIALNPGNELFTIIGRGAKIQVLRQEERNYVQNKRMFDNRPCM
jgi:hypothetical protein